MRRTILSGFGALRPEGISSQSLEAPDGVGVAPGRRTTAIVRERIQLSGHSLLLDPARQLATSSLGIALLFACYSSSSVWAQRPSPYTVIAVQLASDDPPAAIANEARREVLLSRPDMPVDYFSEFLTIEGVRQEDAFLALRDSIRRKHQGRRIDVVIAHTTAVRDFVLRYREELFPNAPIVFSGIDAPMRPLAPRAPE